MNQFKIWYLSSEVSPFAKTGGLADVTAALPKSLKTKNQEIRLMMPKYKTINERKYILREVIRLKDIPVTINNITKTINVKSAFLPESKVQIDGPTSPKAVAQPEGGVIARVVAPKGRDCAKPAYAEGYGSVRCRESVGA